MGRSYFSFYQVSKSLLGVLISIIAIGLYFITPVSGQSGNSPSPIDVTISLYRETPVSTAERAPYERIIEYFADGIFESSNGTHKIGKVTFYTDRGLANKADIKWEERGHPRAATGGRGVEGWQLLMFDIFEDNIPANFLENDLGHKAGGYTLAHEWGHYFYTLYDEYRGSYTEYFSPHSDDEPIEPSIMNAQWKAICSWRLLQPCLPNTPGHFEWLNFSTAQSYRKSNGTDRMTAQWRAYGASGWETLSRPANDDPKDGQRLALPSRTPYPELVAVAPKNDESPRIDLPGSARSDLKINWVGKGITFQIVIDHSGSMSSENKMGNVKTAAKLLVDLAPVGEATVGVVKFDHSVTVVQPLTQINDESTKNDIKSKIDSIQPSGLTAIGDAAKKALDDLLAYGAEDTTRAVFLLTNGQSNSGINPLSVIPVYRNARVPLFTFGYGSNANASTLQVMADGTGGKYYFSPTTLAKLTQVFQDATNVLFPTYGLYLASNVIVNPSAPSLFPIYVDSTLNRLETIVTYKGTPSDVNLALLDPNGTSNNPKDCSVSGAETVCFFSIENPVLGSWKLQATASGSEVALTYRVSGSAKTITYLASVTSLNSNLIKYPQPIVLLAVLSKEWPILGAVVNATVEKPNGQIASFLMLDNGISPDAQTNDGLYSGILDYTENGAYNITVQFDNSAGAAKLTEASFNPSIGPDGVAIPLSEPIQLTENFVRFARIQVNVEGIQTDDHGNVPSSATNLSTDNTDIAGKIDYQGDVDMFKISASSQGALTVRVSNLAQGMDPRVRIFESNGTTILKDIDLSTNSSDNGYLFLPLNLNVNDVIYAEVSQKGDLVGGLYTISAGSQVASDISTTLRKKIYINHDEEYTTEKKVKVTLNYPENTNEIRISNLPLKKDSLIPRWQKSSHELDWYLTGHLGENIVYAQFRFNDGSTSEVYSDSIIYDRTRPWGMVVINGGASSTNTNGVTVKVKITARDLESSVDQMQVSNSASFSGVDWQPYQEEFNWQLESLEGNRPQVRRVYVRLKDKAGNISSILRGFILLKP